MTELNAPPTYTPPNWTMDAQRQRDLDHLRILAVLHYVFGGLIGLGGCCGILYVVLGIFMAADPGAFDDGSGNAPPPFAGGMVAMMGACMMVFLWLLSFLIIYSGRCLATQRNRIFCIVIAVLTCLNIPLGTLLGVFTLVVLARPSVAALFEERRLATLT